MATEIIKSLSLLGALAAAANVHEYLATARSFGGYLQFMPDLICLTFTYTLILLMLLWLGRIVNHLVVVKLLKRENPETSWERWLGAGLGSARGMVGVGAVLLMAQTAPIGTAADYLRLSVQDRSYAGPLVTSRSKALIERTANALPGHTLRSELFPGSS